MRTACHYTHRPIDQEGYVVSHAGDGAKGERMAVDGPCDVILLDVMLPKKGGFDVLRDIRKEGITTPVLMLTARGQVGEKVVGLKLGADDYLTKPFEMLELLARIESLLRRPAASSAAFTTPPPTPSARSRLTSAKWKFEEAKAIEMSAREFQLLRYFIEHRGTVLSREAILNDVWGYTSMPTTRTIDTHVTGSARNWKTIQDFQSTFSPFMDSDTSLWAEISYC